MYTAVIGAGYIALEVSKVFSMLLEVIHLLCVKIVIAYLWQGYRWCFSWWNTSAWVKPFTRMLMLQKVAKNADDSLTISFDNGETITVDYLGVVVQPYSALVLKDGRWVDWTGNIYSGAPWRNTSVPGIYALGDVTGKLDLTPVAIQGRTSIVRRLTSTIKPMLTITDVATVVFSHQSLVLLVWLRKRY